MKLCLPVEKNEGLESPVCGHFGSAPVFMIVDTETLECQAIVNTNQHHAHGMCQPLAALAGESMDGIVVGGIGMGAFSKLQAAGIKVYKTSFRTVRETLDAHKNGALPELTPQTTCGHHH